MGNTFYIETLGCPKNFNDSEYAAGILEKRGYTPAFVVNDADYVLVNTCGFIGDAKKESIDRIFHVINVKKPDAKLVVTGCLAQRYAEELASELPEVDCFVGVDQYGNIADILDGIGEKEKNIYTEACNLDYLEKAIRSFDETPYASTIKIAEGCNKKCSYCAIPFIRGKYRSKKIEDILSEAKDLAAKGCKEIMLIAQDTAYYGYDIYKEYKLPELLKELTKVDGIEWIRLMYCYDDGITDELIEVIATEDKICKYLDIPLQHGSDKVLKEMRRKSSNQYIRELVNKLRFNIPGIVIRTSLMVGFPGETEEDFKDLVNLVEDLKFDRLGVFQYSQEEGTEAGDREDQIPEEIKEARYDEIMLIQKDISLANNEALIDTTQEVMVEYIDEYNEIDRVTSYVGRTRNDAPEIDNGIIFSSSKALKPGDIVKVKITGAFDYDLVGYMED